MTRVYLATGLESCETERDGSRGTGHDASSVVPLAEVVAMAANGELIDAPTLAGVALALRAPRGAALRPVPGRRALDDAEEFLSWLTVERGRAELTIRAYRRDLAAYEADLAARGRRVADATMADVEDHLAALRTSGHGPASVARAHSVLRGLHQFLRRRGPGPRRPDGRGRRDPAARAGSPRR